jgi:hypothetical protein
MIPITAVEQSASNDASMMFSDTHLRARTVACIDNADAIVGEPHMLELGELSFEASPQSTVERMYRTHSGGGTPHAVVSELHLNDCLRPRRGLVHALAYHLVAADLEEGVGYVHVRAVSCLCTDSIVSIII